MPSIIRAMTSTSLSRFGWSRIGSSSSAILVRTGRSAQRACGNSRPTAAGTVTAVFGEFLKEMHLTEGRNTGFRKIRNALHNNGSPEPLFETDEERTYFSTTLYIHPDFEKSKMIAHDGNDGNRDGNDGLTEIETAVFNEIKNSPKLSAQRIADRIGVSKPTVERAQKKLKEKGFIQRQGSTRGSWILLK